MSSWGDVFGEEADGQVSASSFRAAALIADVPPGDHVATLLTEAILPGSEAGSDSGAIWYLTTTKAEHVFHAGLFLLCGRRSITRVERPEHYSCHCQAKSDGAVGESEARSQLNTLFSIHDISLIRWSYLLFLPRGAITCQPYGARHLSSMTGTTPSIPAEPHERGKY